MTHTEVTRSLGDLIAHLDKRQARLVQEIAEAQAGVRAVLSQDAAARYLGISTRTLYSMVQRREGPPHEKRVGTSRSMNERVYYPFPQLKAWKDARTQYDSPEAREQLREESRRARLRAELAEAEAQADALRRALRESGDRRIMAFDGLTSLTQPHPWIFDGNRVLGHALIVSDDDLEQDDLIWLTLHEALAEEWTNLEAHEHFTAIYVGVLESATQQAQSWHRRLRLKAEANKASPIDRSGTIRDL